MTRKHWRSTMNEAMIETTPDELLATLVIEKSKPPRFAGGAWVSGTIAEHRFEALVFPEPADNRAWEVGGDSRISKLWIQQLSDRREVYNWDHPCGRRCTTRERCGSLFLHRRTLAFATPCRSPGASNCPVRFSVPTARWASGWRRSPTTNTMGESMVGALTHRWGPRGLPFPSHSFQESHV